MSARVFVDTNIFLRLYDAAGDPKVITDLRGIAPVLVTTDQVAREFHRNRASLLKHTIKRIDDDIRVSKGFAPIVQQAPAYEKLRVAIDSLEAARKAIIQELRAMVVGELPDPLAVAFDALTAKESGARMIEITPELIEKARRRKLLGDAPASPDKYTVGDEVNWECLLTLNEDLVVVTADKGYVDFESVLRSEYSRATRQKLLLVTERLSEALKLVGAKPEKTLLDAEKKVEENPLLAAPSPLSGSFVVQDGYGNVLASVPTGPMPPQSGSTLLAGWPELHSPETFKK